MIINEVFNNMLNSPVRYLRGRVEVYEGSTLSLICGCHDALREFTVERTGEGKFFGYGICQKINVNLIDFDRNVNITTANSLEVEFGIDNDYIYPFPRFYVTDVYRDENNNEVSVTGYDALYKAAEHTVSELTLPSSYTIGEFATACASFLGIPIKLNSFPEFNIDYPIGANYEGTETLREALDDIAEATQTIYFIDWNWNLVFKRLDRDGEAQLTIDREKYITLDAGANRRLATIVNATELGDNVSVSISTSGSTQYVRDNPFWELREDIATLLDGAIAAAGNLTINQFECDWRGNFLLEIGDKIELITKNGESVYSYLLNDSLTFDGSLSQVTEWEYDENETETENNPNNLGDALKQTYAKVDKANKQIDLVVTDLGTSQTDISNLQLTTEGITASVTEIKELTEEEFTNVNDSLASLASQVQTKVTANDVSIAIQTELDNGVDKVITKTGFVFDDTGLTVSKSDSEMETTVTEDGMKVFKNDEEVLVANNVGVSATNLHANTFLIIGTNSRFEDYKDGARTACFWIGV